ncbi:SusE domain-containing protein [Flavobacterium sp. F-328]|jgi:hypothetical protein|uniref:SusE domain-containing protein n=1 Tax=Flavobacterium erciyesense TaxID=2825842 RepID=A0ABS5D743_9FLAO|nr:SusE domain-containing protein [Flavobacterium erciyesense]MBQ0909863.1 SusE domain-containing protein [Flavobacterium erciyesense]
MKNITKSVIALFAVLALSCNVEDVEDRPVIQGIDTPEMVAPENDKSYVLQETNANNVAERFVWTKANYDGAVEIGYKLLIDVKGGDFSKAVEIGGTSGATQAEVTVKTLNQAVIQLGGIPEQLGSYDVKVVSSIAGIEKMMSAKPLTILVNAYTGLVPYAFTDWYLVGDATTSGWNNNNKNQPLFRSGTNANVYQFTGFFKAGAFKLISTPGQWAPMYGRGDNGAIVARPTEADADPSTFDIAADGYYTFSVNIETLKYTLVAYNAATAATFPTVGIIGNSTPLGWDASTPMTKSTFDPHIWTIDVLALVDGKAKFRANNAWDVNWGGNTAFSAFPNNGTSGGDIPVAKSKYKIFFNDLDGSYLMIPNQK